MTFEAHSAATDVKHSSVLLARGAGLVNSVSQFGAKMRVKGASFLKRLQVAKMKSILMSLSDDQLAQINISRSEIASYAESLIMDE